MGPDPRPSRCGSCQSCTAALAWALLAGLCAPRAWPAPPAALAQHSPRLRWHLGLSSGSPGGAAEVAPTQWAERRGHSGTRLSTPTCFKAD